MKSDDDDDDDGLDERATDMSIKFLIILQCKLNTRASSQPHSLTLVRLHQKELVKIYGKNGFPFGKEELLNVRD